MNPTVDELVAQAEQLPLADRELLVDRLRQTLPTSIDPDIEAAWIAEAERRLDAIDRGEEKTVPWEKVRKDLRLR
jgi:putative addiction module component (TIGR02574 family)